LSSIGTVGFSTTANILCRAVIPFLGLGGGIFLTTALPVISLGSFAYLGLKHKRNMESKLKKDK